MSKGLNAYFAMRSIKSLTKRILKKFGYSILPTEKLPFYPLGHYYSPIPSTEEILRRERQIFGIQKKEIDGIDLNEEAQFNLLEKLKDYYRDLPFEDSPKDGLRYFYRNGSYPYSDAVFLYSMMRHFQPRTIIEIGSGYSSALMLDTNDHFMKNQCKCYFIEPYPSRLLSVLKEGDLKTHKLYKNLVQEVRLDVYKELKENDILFVDSSHVAKTGSDVNHIFFNILPSLNQGVLIHFHDIFYPFEYPKEWVLNKWAWNEDYILRAFLQYNSSFKIVLFNTFLERYYEEWFRDHMPICLKNPGGSIWLRKL